MGEQERLVIDKLINNVNVVGVMIEVKRNKDLKQQIFIGKIFGIKFSNYN